MNRILRKKKSFKCIKKLNMFEFFFCQYFFLFKCIENVTETLSEYAIRNAGTYVGWQLVSCTFSCDFNKRRKRRKNEENWAKKTSNGLKRDSCHTCIILHDVLGMRRAVALPCAKYASRRSNISASYSPSKIVWQGMDYFNIFSFILFSNRLGVNLSFSVRILRWKI